jgi:hypothetical protein
VWVGLCAVEVSPSPKSQSQAVGVFAEESVNVISAGTTPMVAEGVKSATGGSPTSM